MGYGNIMDVETTGASELSAKQDNLTYSGVRASHTMAKTDSDRMEKYKSKINTVGGKYEINPAIIAGIISRESRAGNALKDGWGDWDPKRQKYNAWGLMQVDINRGGHTAQGAWDSEERLSQGTKILVDKINQIVKKHPDWTPEQQLKGGIAAYNMGAGNVRTIERMDVGSSHGDYSSDVVARAQWYKSNGF